MSLSITILDTHPVQYRAPIYCELERLRPGCFTVLYGSDFSVRGYRDIEFGAKFSWDIPLLEGYRYEIAAPGAPHDLAACRAVLRHLWRRRPDVLLLSDVHRPLFWAGYLGALLLGIDLWIRHEGQDEAYKRSATKAFFRAIYYRLAYLPARRFFYFGKLNYEHFRRHGVAANRLWRTPFATIDGQGARTTADKAAARQARRSSLGIAEKDFVVGFFGKLIPKKNPDLILAAVARLPAELRRRTVVLYVGSGQLDAELRQAAEVEAAAGGARTVFAGFINQTGLPDYYLAADVVVLPSRQDGEVWGLVVNEALQAGCGIVISTAVGCAAEFGTLPRVAIIGIEDGVALAEALVAQAARPRDFDWAAVVMQDYSIATAARGIVAAVDNINA